MAQSVATGGEGEDAEAVDYGNTQLVCNMMGLAWEGLKRNMRFQVCDVARPLGSVAAMCEAAHSVTFNPPGDHRVSYI